MNMTFTGYGFLKKEYYQLTTNANENQTITNNRIRLLEA